MCLLHRLRANLSLFLITIALLTTISSVFGQPTYNYHYCSNISYNDTANIKTLLGSLSSKAALNNRFYIDTSKDLHGLYQCRGDVATDVCQTCVEVAIQEIQQSNRCQFRSRADIWYDECTLRYARTSFFGTVKLDPLVLMYNTGNASSPNNTYVDTLSLMRRLASEAGKEPMMYYAHEELPATAGDVAPKNVSAMVQCCKDISGDDCNRCLQNLTMYAETCCLEKSGWRILAPSCNMRYEEYRFLTPSAPPPAPTTTSKGKVVLIITIPVSTFLVVAFGFYFYRLFGRRSKAREVLQGMSQEILLNNLESQTRKRFIVNGLEVQDEDDSREMHYFDLTTLEIATNNFSDANKLGQGGFGPVYKGKLHDGKEIAVKRLSSNSGQGLEEFRTEVKLIVKLQHRNLVRLLGCCIKKDEKLLVYEYMANTSLDAFLFDSIKCKELDWAKRENIVTGIAKGLLYLHEDSRLKIIHRDMKASNVLLDDEMNPKISDFGTARICYGNQIEASTNRIVGTYGYMAPEYAMEGIFSVKSDVYSFGVLMLEIISGRRNNASFNLPARAQGFLQNAWQLWNDGKAQELIDRNLIGSCPVQKVAIWINIALLCVQENPDDRPSMSKVAFMLGGQSTEIAKPSEPPFSVGRYPMSDQSSSTGGGTEPASIPLTLPRE
ncbi:hypothetical protein HYC85_018407 [Camellia sinensis]|uniref:non-specific serine/threonine protein kinase n=1 Tax=Camellia sinensis TaxID=4442 RepID=A0A7J7GUJ0_CAMSI|nr:hypothetical protein HYC85_018407 [Camellia sinensis]